MINRTLKTGNRRFEFERLYLENADPWNYATDEYERDKYHRTLDTVVQLRRGAASVLEIGCSVGVFSKMLSNHFVECAAVDMSEEALRIARSRNVERKNLDFVRGDVRFLRLNRRFDVITCAETLYYIDSADADRVARTLTNHLAENGIIVSISGVASDDVDVAQLDACEVALSRSLEIIERAMIADPRRPYRIVVFGGASVRAV